MNATWTGIISSATTSRNSPSRNGKLSHENAYAAIEASVTGMSVDGTAMRNVFRNDWPSMPCASMTAA